MTKENIRCYNKMRQVFLDNVKPGDIYDVDMFCSDLCKSLFLETDPQDIGEDDYLVFREALILLVRDDMLLDWFGLAGLCIIYTEMSSNGENYYINKTCWKEDEPGLNEKLDARQVAENFGLSDNDDFMTALREVMGEEE